ncbi:class I SAM-dependent methyltransferase [Aquisalimonas lutea]|uniref:class I SAM-dependent methyltransferase n=1 Tax=Aquisalimonas lutea TaxID=1327750 RepID=UPI0025B4FAAA|nr:class I SAM-dependent methyltransferase [Aquisalimonas lutea]MDN3518542.1 class I SAM-dependent methyltransferase [Aquisalimonas lutea]
MNGTLANRWDRHYSTASPLDGRPAQVLTDNLHLLPAGGLGLDLAAGLGANALVLARQGIASEAWDVSGVATRIVNAYAGDNGLPVTARRRDVIASPPTPGGFDVIVVNAFLHRELCPAIADALRPGGLLFYQTFCRTRVTPGGPSNPDYLLADGELLRLFAALIPVVYREEGRIGDPFRGFRDRAMLVAQRPNTRDTA